MKLMRPISGLMLASALACGGEGSSSTGGSSSGVDSTGGTSDAGETTGTNTGTSPATDPTTGAPSTTTDEPDTTVAPTSEAPTSTTSTGDPTGVTSEASSSSSSGGVTGSQCEGSGLAICEDFEDAEDGAFPDGWGARGDEWGEGVIGVASDEARLGARALKIDGGNNGQHFMDYKGELGGLASQHFGRVFMKVAIPAPWPVDGVLHADFIEGLGPGPKGGTHNVRWGVVENTGMKMQWIYNVQPSNAPEFAEGTGYDYAWTGEWQCIEWFYDQPAQQGGLWIDGVEMPIVPGKNHEAEIPVFDSLGVGLANYQPAGAGFTVWFDELAYDPERIGCEL